LPAVGPAAVPAAHSVDSHRSALIAYRPEVFVTHRSVVVVLAAAVSVLSSCQSHPVAASATVTPPSTAVAKAAIAQEVAATMPAAFAGDPALLRRELLRRFDARIDAMAAQLHVEARLVIDEVSPIPYLGLDAQPVDGGMKVTAVYGGTGAKDAGLRVGDLLLQIGDEKVDSHAALAHSIRHRIPGSTLVVKVVRDGQNLELHGKLGQRPEEDEDEAEQFPDLPGAKLEDSKEPFVAHFDGDELGVMPANLVSALGGHGLPPRWIAAPNDGGRCLRQDSADRAGIHFPMALARGFEAHDVVGRVRLHYAGGEVDRAGGVVLRYHDAGNYYVARVNAAEGDLRIFRVANGVRRTLPGGKVMGATDDAEWHTLEFRAEGSKLTATLDGKFTAVAYDSYFLQGGAGVWTKSDSITEFDDLEFEVLPRGN
jgi:hypothetical protein